MLSIIDTNCSREPTVSAKTGCVDLVFEDDETAIAVRDAIAAEHPFEPKEPPASAERRDNRRHQQPSHRKRRSPTVESMQNIRSNRRKS